MISAMADETPASDDKCLACDIAFWTLVGLGALLVGVIAFDTFSGGKASEFIERAFGKVPRLASVSPIGGNDDASAG
jgi:hypothetical protein